MNTKVGTSVHFFPHGCWYDGLLIILNMAGYIMLLLFRFILRNQYLHSERTHWKGNFPKPPYIRLPHTILFVSFSRTHPSLPFSSIQPTLSHVLFLSGCVGVIIIWPKYMIETVPPTLSLSDSLINLSIIPFPLPLLLFPNTLFN